MSVGAITTNNLFDYGVDPRAKLQQMQKEFQQLGQDLQSGNLSAAQSDFATLSALSPQSTTSSAATSSTSAQNSPIAQALAQLSQDLQSGNLTAAQQDYSTLQKDFQSASAVHASHHHHHSGGRQDQISQVFNQLGQALQSGDMTSAQTLFSTLQQDFQGQSNAPAPSPAEPNAVSTKPMSVTA